MKKLIFFLFWVSTVLTLISNANALTFTFSDKDYLSGAIWGTMVISVIDGDADTLMIRYDASESPPIPWDPDSDVTPQVTAFGFTFVPSTLIPDTVSNPDDGDFSYDLDALNWTKLSKVNQIPNPANGDEFVPAIDKADFFFGATEGEEGNINPPGILPDETDVYYLNFESAAVDFLDLDFSLDDFVALTGIRLQSLPNDINEGSLFLVGKTGNGDTPVPEPTTMLLFGCGLFGMGVLGRKRFFNRP